MFNLPNPNDAKRGATIKLAWQTALERDVNEALEDASRDGICVEVPSAYGTNPNQFWDWVCSNLPAGYTLKIYSGDTRKAWVMWANNV